MRCALKSQLFARTFGMNLADLQELLSEVVTCAITHFQLFVFMLFVMLEPENMLQTGP